MTFPASPRSASLSGPTYLSRSTIDAALLALRVGVGISVLLLFALKQSEASKVFDGHSSSLALLVILATAALCVTAGFLTRWAAAISLLAWLGAALLELHAGADWFVQPVRSAEFAFLFAALALTGPGKYSLDRRHK